MASAELKSSLAQFVTFARGLKGDEKSEAQSFLDHFFRALEEPGANPLRDAHTHLDTTIRTTYAMPANAEPLAFLLALNLTLATKEKAGEPITPPGLPLPETDRTAFITDDCVKVTEP